MRKASVDFPNPVKLFANAKSDEATATYALMLS
jgi:hypothetical protein